jgi:hypothetical protein
MKPKKLILTVFIGILLFSGNLTAQGYQTGLGIRFGGLTSGLTVKSFLSKTSAIEGILSVGHKNFIVTGLYEMHSQIDHSSLFKVFYGIGGHVGFFQDGGTYYYHDTRLYTGSTVAGVDGIIGLDYKFRTTPINISMDFKPFVDFFNGGIVYFDGGISVRYTF